MGEPIAENPGTEKHHTTLFRSGDMDSILKAVSYSFENLFTDLLSKFSEEYREMHYYEKNKEDRHKIFNRRITQCVNN